MSPNARFPVRSTRNPAPVYTTKRAGARTNKALAKNRLVAVANRLVGSGEAVFAVADRGNQFGVLAPNVVMNVNERRIVLGDSTDTEFVSLHPVETFDDNLGIVQDLSENLNNVCVDRAVETLSGDPPLFATCVRISDAETIALREAMVYAPATTVEMAVLELIAQLDDIGAHIDAPICELDPTDPANWPVYAAAVSGMVFDLANQRALMVDADQVTRDYTSTRNYSKFLCMATHLRVYLECVNALNKYPGSPVASLTWHSGAAPDCDYDTSSDDTSSECSESSSECSESDSEFFDSDSDMAEYDESDSECSCSTDEEDASSWGLCDDCYRNNAE